MEKQPFNNEGIQALVAHIYALSIANYQAELELIRSNFASYLVSRFEFTEQEFHYLNQLHSNDFYYLGASVANALEQQSPIVLQREAPSGNNSGGGEGKVIETNQRTQTIYTINAGLQQISSLVIHIRYIDTTG